MVASKVTHSSIQWKVAIVVVEVVEDSIPLPQTEGNSIMLASPYNPSQYDHVQLIVSQEIF